jgi:hypothetical protein
MRMTWSMNQTEPQEVAHTTERIATRIFSDVGNGHNPSRIRWRKSNSPLEYLEGFQADKMSSEGGVYHCLNDFSGLHQSEVGGELQNLNSRNH